MKHISLFICVMFFANLVYGQDSTSNYPGYTKCAFTQNGFRLKKGEITYTNIYLLYNNIQFGITDFLSAGFTFIPIPVSSESRSGVFPIIMITAKAGYSLGKYNHLSVSSNLATNSPGLINPTIAYTFGTPRYYVGLAGLIENVSIEKDLLLVQGGVGISKKFLIATEFALAEQRSSLVKDGSSSSYSSPSNIGLFSIIGKLTLGKNKATLNLGYFTLHDDEMIFILGISLRLNKHHEG